MIQPKRGDRKSPNVDFLIGPLALTQVFNPSLHAPIASFTRQLPARHLTAAAVRVLKRDSR